MLRAAAAAGAHASRPQAPIRRWPTPALALAAGDVEHAAAQFAATAGALGLGEALALPHGDFERLRAALLTLLGQICNLLPRFDTEVVTHAATASEGEPHPSANLYCGLLRQLRQLLSLPAAGAVLEDEEVPGGGRGMPMAHRMLEALLVQVGGRWRLSGSQLSDWLCAEIASTAPPNPSLQSSHTFAPLRRPPPADAVLGRALHGGRPRGAGAGAPGALRPRAPAGGAHRGHRLPAGAVRPARRGALHQHAAAVGQPLPAVSRAWGGEAAGLGSRGGTVVLAPTAGAAPTYLNPCPLLRPPSPAPPGPPSTPCWGSGSAT